MNAQRSIECRPEICGCATNVKNIQDEQKAQWEEISKMGRKIDEAKDHSNKTLNRMNLLIVVFLLGIIADLAVRVVTKGG